MRIAVYVKHQLAVRLAAMGLALLAIARWLDGHGTGHTGQRRDRAAQAPKQIDLPRHNYRIHNYRIHNAPAPGRLEVLRLWVSVWVRAWQFALVGA